MKVFLFLLVVFFGSFAFAGGDDPIDVGRIPTETIKVRNIFLTIGKDVPQGVVHWLGDLYITTTENKCTYKYVWEKDKLVQKDKQCPK